MYAMKAITSSIFFTMLFPHNGTIVTIDQPTHYEPNQLGHIDNVIPLIHSSDDLLAMVYVGPRIFHDLSLIGSYQGHTPPTPCADQVCVISSDGKDIPDDIPLEESLNPIPNSTSQTLPEEPSLNYSLEEPLL
jgi:hypothetical protein